MITEITGGAVLIDDADYALVKQFKWHVNDNGYAVWRGFKNGRKQTIRMHRLIMGAAKDEIVDHINHNELDNRKSNLRICTQSDNMRNRRNQGKGYYYHRQNQNWVVDVNGKHRGTFDTESQAAAFVKLVRSGETSMKQKQERVFCKYGHSLSDAYDYGKGKLCRKCQSLRSKEYYRRKNMTGNKSGGRLAANTSKNLHGDDFFARIGKIGGSKKVRKGFAIDNRSFLDKLLRKPKRAQLSGKLGGTLSKRRPKNENHELAQTETKTSQNKQRGTKANRQG